MLQQTQTNNTSPASFNGPFYGNSHLLPAFHTDDPPVSLLQKYRHQEADEILHKPVLATGKKSFLVFKNNKYLNILTENIAFFSVSNESSIIVTFDRQEYFVSHSLEQIQHMVNSSQFFRMNRQYLVNFNAIKEAEHYFARKLLVNLNVPTKDKLLISKEKVSSFLHWLDNR